MCICFRYPYGLRDVMKQDIAHNSRAYNRFQDRTHRQTDVNDPTYELNGKVIADNPRYTKPKKNKSYIPDNHLLQTRDIAGAYPGWINPDFKQVSQFTFNLFVNIILA